MPAWWRREQEGAPGEDDLPTGQIEAARLAEIIRAADALAGGPGEERLDEAGTGVVADASDTDVNPAHALASAGPEELRQALADRQALIQMCLYALDRARSGGVVERLEQGLAGIGVRALRPDGQRFDPALHEAGGAVPTDDAALEGTVAETEVVGFVDHEKLLRAPIVTVYTRR